MRLRLKLITGFMAVSLLVGMVGSLGLYANKHVVASYESGEEYFGSIIEASNEISSYAKRTEGHTMLFLTLHNETDRQKSFKRIASLREQITFIGSRVNNIEAKRILERINSRTDELQSIVESLFKAYDSEMNATGSFEPRNHEELIRKLDDAGAGIRNDGLELAKVELNLQTEQQGTAQKNAAFFYNIIFIISAIAIISALVLGYAIARNIADPVNKLKDAAIDIGKGNLGTRMEIKSRDEIGELAGAFNKMAEDLQNSSNERKLAEEQIKSSLQEKEWLLREIHHRVKNNMQIVSSLLMHQSEYIKDKNIVDIFAESQNRIASMSLIHEKLYQSKDLAKIDFNEYVTDMVAGLLQSHGVNAGNIVINLNVENVSLDIDYAIPCGLIINELVTNSLKYAFPAGKKGEINISFRSTDHNIFELMISDNGTGIPKDLDFRKTESLGLHLVTVLAENQLHGEINLNQSKGTEFQIKFRGIK